MVKDSITQGLSDLGSNISGFFSDLGENIGTWFTDLGNNLKNLLSYINPFDENFLGKKLVELIGSLLEDLFIPKDDHFTELHNEINTKLGFVGQVKDLYNSLFPDNSPNSITAPPNWKITYKGVTVDIIDWSSFEEYRGYLHSIIIFIMWASFLIRLYKRIPVIIYGYTDK